MNETSRLSINTTQSAIFTVPCTEIKYKPPLVEWNVGILTSSAPILTEHFENGYSSFVVLTGQTNSLEIIAPPELIQNICIAKQINAYVQSKFPMPANHALKSDMIRELLAQNEIAKANTLILENFERQTQIRESSSGIPSLLDHGVGSCKEMATTGFLFANKHLLGNVERAIIENGDHHFLVIGRDPRGDPRNYITWGENAAICDPWSGAYYPLSYLEVHLKDYIGCQTDESGFLHCMVNPFNPLFHKLRILASNMEEMDKEGSPPTDKNAVEPNI